MSEDVSIAVIGATRSQLGECKNALEEYRVYGINNSPEGVNTAKVRGTTCLMLVFAAKTQFETLQTCRALRSAAKTSSIPLLLAANRYDITHAFVVRRMGNADIVLSPFTAEELRESVESLVTETASTD